MCSMSWPSVLEHALVAESFENVVGSNPGCDTCILEKDTKLWLLLITRCIGSMFRTWWKKGFNNSASLVWFPTESVVGSNPGCDTCIPEKDNKLCSHHQGVLGVLSEYEWLAICVPIWLLLLRFSFTAYDLMKRGNQCQEGYSSKLSLFLFAHGKLEKCD